MEIQSAEPAHNIDVPIDAINDEDAIFQELERDDDMEGALFREQRMEQLRREAHKLQEMKASAHGTYEEIRTEKEVLKITTTTKFCVVHFFHKEFRRCQIMDKHLGILARKHFKTRFIKVDVDNAPFLVDRLKIQVLPCVVCFIDGIAADRLVGFDELGLTDSFQTNLLEQRLDKASVIMIIDQPTHQSRKTIFGFNDKKNNDDDDEDDEDD
ncbi:hypothetical protein SmJEL517_g04065 [Synchytrium microbalum]|uniref:Thioredoxin domain-containing protein n=1 Tax=Synchytrium microbalum TaxID=1806994 RepID=A0A507BVJ9_9FUNG|nr:uncharacterized protein SmJEL517_g04065 [Synchytrium microbalum]TPX32907.1 hypothetical protein SmJEL517_g04065 [Synchytrium microbalum]